jgi:hypothetical protein
MQICFQWSEAILDGSRMLRRYVQFVRGFSPYATAWQAGLTGGLEEPNAKEILTWVLCICSWHAPYPPTRPEQNKYTEILQIHKNACNQRHRMRATNWWLLHHCILLVLYRFEQSATLRMSYFRHHWIISFGVHLLAQWVYHQHRIATLEFKSTSNGSILPSRGEQVSIPSLLHRCVGIYINKTTSSS